VHSKQVRRRRIVLALLVAASLILLTDYFGESPSSPLHTVQRGLVAVLVPVQEGASKVLSPFRSAANWVSGTFNARSQVAQLRKQNEQLIRQLAQARQAEIENQQLSRQLNFNASNNIDQWSPVSATVIGQDLSPWNQQIEVDKGSGDGVLAGDPVIGDGGLVGDVKTVVSGASIVTLLTDPSFAVPAEVEDGGGPTGVLVPEAGNPSSMLLTDLPPQATVENGDYVVTAGFKDNTNPALIDYYPTAIPIGKVTSFSADTLNNQHQVQVTPFVNLRGLSVVEILIRAAPATTQRAQVGAP
jgi:rod shape-determining protein MreC